MMIRKQMIILAIARRAIILGSNLFQITTKMVVSILILRNRGIGWLIWKWEQDSGYVYYHLCF